MKPAYKNWMPKGMVLATLYGTCACAVLFVLFGVSGILPEGSLKQVLFYVFLAAMIVMAAVTLWMFLMYRAFSYDGSRQMSKQIIEGVAARVTIPDGGCGLDVGCGSGALTIACAKRNPGAQMLGCDIWSGAYKAVFTKKRCEENAKAEGVSNVRFTEGNAVRLPFPDESFDAVTSNYVYHNIAGHNKQQLLLETLRVLKKGGTFAIHDLMSRARYGDMDAFVQKLKAEGYEDLRLIDTTDGRFLGRREAVLLGLVGSTLLVGRK